MNVVQIGSGSANFDTSIKDGFTSFIKKNRIKGKILIVEANSIHLKNLKFFWKSSKNVKIFNLAITPDNILKKKMNFFYSEDDKPNFQLFSNSKLFVKKHYPHGKIKKKNCKLLKYFKVF